MVVYEFKIKPLGFFSESISSYTLFGAVSWALSYLEGRDFLEEFFSCVRDGRILFSSAMPIIKGERHFFKPILPPKFIPEEERRKLFKDDTEFRIAIKKFKKLRFIPEEIFFEFIEDSKSLDEFSLFRRVWNWLKSEEPARVYSVHSTPHASIDRLVGSTGESGEFFFERSYFVGVDELFFFIAFDNLAFRFKTGIEAAIRLLSDWGLGGNRSIGFGRFEFLGFCEYKCEHNRSGSSICDLRKYITLSPVLATGRIEYENSFYDIFVYRGAVDGGLKRITSNIWKKRVVYLREGSLLKVKEGSKLAGGILEETSNSGKIYQYGLEFPVHFLYKEKES